MPGSGALGYTVGVTRLLPLALLALIFAGCNPPRVKGWESFRSATTPHGPTTWAGDIYSYGGNAASTGGTRTRTLYGAGADPQGRPFPGYDAPTKGTGSQPGENPPSNVPWWASQNAPALQPAPGTQNGNGTRVPN